jgi:pSer/pThr/pTyr-binding forkhead associated (FHA) protein
VLTKIGDTFDRLTGRGWKPSSSLATSELAEQLKSLLDAQVRIEADGRKFVPHFIRLRMQWDKFSDDRSDSLKKLETQLLTAAVDHINDRHYYTYAPLDLQAMPDYFTEGVRLNVSFDLASDENVGEHAVALPGTESAANEPKEDSIEVHTTAAFTLNGEQVVKNLHFINGKRIRIGRTKENDLAIDETSISKYHASIVLEAGPRYFIADTGSTNGTFINGERMSYGRSVRLRPSDVVRFGNVEVNFDLKAAPVVNRPEPNTEILTDVPNVTTIGDMQFSTRENLGDTFAENVPAEQPENSETT